MPIKPKIICTIGPGLLKEDILLKLKGKNVDFFRINLSHTDEEEIEKKVKDLIGYGVPIILDTEGSQIRSGNTNEIFIDEDSIVKVHGSKISCDNQNIFLNPEGVIKNIQNGDLISIDFNSLLLRVFDTSTKEKGYVLCKAVIGGLMGGKKAVQIDNLTLNLPAFSKKDHRAVEIAKKYGIRHFTLSFMESSQSVVKFRQNYPSAIIYSKIESKKGLDNFIEIAQNSDGILIDRGDLSSQVPMEKIPFIQKYIIKKVREMGKEAFVATNTLEQMAFSLKPNKAEVNDIINTLMDGATGIALTKETAVGKYPVETVNILSNLMNQFNFLNESNKDNIIDKIEEKNYLYSLDTPELLIKPHGGSLVNRFDPNYKGKIPGKVIEINEEELMDVEQIAIGAFSPLEGFMSSSDFKSVTENMRLSNGIIWPLPIVLQVEDTVGKNLGKGEEISLLYKGELYAILHLEEVYSLNKEEAAKKIFGTNERVHPGVKRFLEAGNYFLGGKITLLKKLHSEHKVYELTPKQTRKIFYELGWSKVIGFHTRNVIHKSHEFIQIEGMRRSLCDGLFIHPIIGKKKPGDFEAETIIRTYEKMIENFYPKSKVMMGTFASYSRYGGPREAIFTALVRKNFGCSHFIVGRDHTGVGSFYTPNASHEIFDVFPQEELGIIPIKFNNVFYSDLENRHLHESDFIDYPEEHKVSISGTKVREMFLHGIQPPDWFMRPEISQIILEKIQKGEKVFVE